MEHNIHNLHNNQHLYTQNEVWNNWQRKKEYEMHNEESNESALEGMRRREPILNNSKYSEMSHNGNSRGEMMGPILTMGGGQKEISRGYIQQQTPHIEEQKEGMRPMGGKLFTSGHLFYNQNGTGTVHMSPGNGLAVYVTPPVNQHRLINITHNYYDTRTIAQTTCILAPIAQQPKSSHSISFALGKCMKGKECQDNKELSPLIRHLSSCIENCEIRYCLTCFMEEIINKGNPPICTKCTRPITDVPLIAFLKNIEHGTEAKILEFDKNPN